MFDCFGECSGQVGSCYCVVGWVGCFVCGRECVGGVVMMDWCVGGLLWGALFCAWPYWYVFLSSPGGVWVCCVDSAFDVCLEGEYGILSNAV